MAIRFPTLLRFPKTGALLLFIAVVGLLALSMYRSYTLGQYRTMYDNPIYRWRISMAVALSEMRNPPLEGYVAYGSIVKYMNHQGLALMEGESPSMPSIEEVQALVRSPDALEAIFQNALKIHIDYKLPPVPIVGNEKGEAAFYYFAFRLFGIHLEALWWSYFLLLAISSLLFFFAFWRSRLCVLLLMVYLIAHFYMTDFASTAYIQTVHNSRFFTVLALLPSLHLLMLSVRKERLTLASFILAAGQVFLLFFVIFCRMQAAWQLVAIVSVTVLVLPYKRLWCALRRRAACARAAGNFVMAGWPAGMIVAGALGLIAYQHIALDPRAYATEMTTHTFWDPVLVGTISASPELTALYGLGEEPYSDTMGFILARQYLRDQNDTSSPLANVSDGKIQINIMKNMGIYDNICKNIFFHIVLNHPWLVLKSFFYDKELDQFAIMMHMKIFFLDVFLFSIGLAIGSGLYIKVIGSPIPQRSDVITAAWLGPLAGLFSLSTTFITPSVMVADTCTVFLMILLTIPTFTPIAIAGWWADGAAGK